jgi:cold shock CspA family protein
VVRIDLKVPGGEIVVNHDHHQDVYVALRDAFAAARRRLEDVLRRTRGEVKAHEPEFTGRVARMFPEDGCGFIEAADGRELYFSRDNVVAPGFEQLAIGTEVHFIQEMVMEGLHAKRVSARRNHPAR